MLLEGKGSDMTNLNVIAIREEHASIASNKLCVTWCAVGQTSIANVRAIARRISQEAELINTFRDADLS
jgi:hypothetical protein